MTRRPVENRAATLAAVLASAIPGAAPHMVGRAVVAMIAAARAHKREAERECSFAWASEEPYRTRAERRLVKLAAAAERAIYDAASGASSVSGAAPVIAASIDGTGATRVVLSVGAPRWLRLAFGGDPRGPCATLYVSDMPGDGWGSDDSGLRAWPIYA